MYEPLLKHWAAGAILALLHTAAYIFLGGVDMAEGGYISKIGFTEFFLTISTYYSTFLFFADLYFKKISCLLCYD